MTTLNIDRDQPELRLYFGRSDANHLLRRSELFNCLYVRKSHWAIFFWDCGFEFGGKVGRDIDVYHLLVLCFDR